MSTLKGPITLEDAARFLSYAYAGYGFSKGSSLCNTETRFFNAENLPEKWWSWCINELPQPLRNYCNGRNIVNLIRKQPTNFAAGVYLLGSPTLFENKPVLIEAVAFNKTALEDLITGQAFKSGFSEFSFNSWSPRELFDIFPLARYSDGFYSFLDKKIIEAQARINSQLAAAAVNIAKLID